MLRNMFFVGLTAFIISGVIIWRGDIWIEAFIEGYLITLFVSAIMSELFSISFSLEEAVTAVGASWIGAILGAIVAMNVLN